MFAFQSVKWAEVVDRIEHRGGKKKIVLGRQEEYFWVKKYPIQSPGISAVLKKNPACLVKNCIEGNLEEGERMT